jgi:hypothetical protein
MELPLLPISVNNQFTIKYLARTLTDDMVVLLSTKDVEGKKILVRHLADFGIAKLIEADTVPGNMVDGKHYLASPLYMSPVS